MTHLKIEDHPGLADLNFDEQKKVFGGGYGAGETDLILDEENDSRKPGIDFPRDDGTTIRATLTTL